MMTTVKLPCLSVIVLLLLPAAAVINNKCDLVVTNDGRNLHEDVCVAQFGEKDCAQFSKTFKKETLPVQLGITSQYGVQEPSELKVEMSKGEPIGNFTYPSLQLQWSSPDSGSARFNLRGFYLELHNAYKTDNTNNMCYIFKIDLKSFVDRKLVFGFTINYPELKPSTDYDVRVYSIPTPVASLRDDSRHFAGLRVKTSERTSIHLYPRNWLPTISTQVKNNTLEACFNLAPKEYKFSVYNVRVSNRKNSYQTYMSTSYHVKGTLDEHQGCVEFPNLPKNQYRVSMSVVDTKGQNKSACLCWYKEEGDKLCGKCLSRRTGWIEVKYVNKTTSGIFRNTRTNKVELHHTVKLTTAKSHESTKSAASVANKHNYQTPRIAIAVGSVAIFLLLIFLVLFFVLTKRGKKLVAFLKKKVKSDKNVASISNLSQSSIAKNTAASLSLKKVYILSAEEHPLYVDLVDKFATFLQVHCHCEVIYSGWSSVHQEGGICWVVKNMTRSDFVLFIDTPSSDLILKAYLDNMTYPTRNIGPEGDLFSLGLKHVFTESPGNRVIPLCFDGQPRCKLLLLATVEYSIPDHMAKLLQRIHMLSEKDVTNFSGSLPLQPACIKRLTEGSNLLKAISKIHNLEAENPNWVTDTYGDPSPVMKVKSLTSQDSAYSSIDKDGDSQIGLSVSTQDLTRIHQQADTKLSKLEKTQQFNHLQGTINAYNDHNLEDGTLSESNSTLTRSTYINSDVYPQETKSIVDKALKANRDKNSGAIPKKLNKTNLNVSDKDNCNADTESTVQNKTYLGMAVLPPESTSQIVCDSVSTALNGFSGAFSSNPDVQNDITNTPNQNGDSNINSMNFRATKTIENSIMSPNEIQRLQKEESKSPKLSDFIVPPESASQFGEDTVSAALGAIQRQQQTF